MKKTYKLSAEWTMTKEVEIQASSYKEALEVLDNMDIAKLNESASYLENSFENNVQMNLILNEDNEMTLSEIEIYHGTKL